MSLLPLESQLFEAMITLKSTSVNISNSRYGVRSNDFSRSSDVTSD